MTCERTIDAGAYVLHALEEGEAAGFAAHLRDCAECRHEVEQLQIAADTLPVAVPQLAPPPALRDRIMREVRAEAELLQASGPQLDRAPAPRGTRWWQRLAVRPAMAGALACALLAVGVGAGVAIRGTDNGPSTRTVPAKVAMAGASGELRVTGNRAALHVEGMRSPGASRVYQVWFVKGGDRPIPTHTLFDVRNDGRATVQIEEPIEGVRQILVTAEPSGGSATPTSAPVISATPA